MVSNKRKVGVDMTVLLRRIRLTILGKELLHEITEDAWNDGYSSCIDNLIDFNTEDVFKLKMHIIGQERNNNE